mgnify:CR=1 FL=1
MGHRRALRRALRVGLIAAAAAVASACASPGRDGPPGRLPVDLDSVPDAVPRPEPRSRLGNPPEYEVNGRVYRVLASSSGYVVEGVASWYGTKFHGQATSSGEPYDMFQMTAAHRTLPLPTYAEVTRLDTGRRVIVRINDRGPFHPDRIIDLSYAAAHRLGMTEAGTARVRVRAISVAPYPEVLYVQVGAFSVPESAQALAARLEAAGLVPVHVAPGGEDRPIHRVRIGPFAAHAQAFAAIDRLAEIGITDHRLITLTESQRAES